MKMILDSINLSNPITAEIIEEAVRSIGISPSNWSWCQKKNRITNECPIQQYAEKKNYTMIVASYNPSGIPIEVIEL